MMIFAPPLTAIAICTICCCAIVSDPTGRQTSSVVPISASMAAARHATASRAARRHRVASEDPAPRWQRPEAKVFRHRQVLAEGELLVHHTHARGQRIARALELRLAPVNEHADRVGFWDARKELP